MTHWLPDTARRPTRPLGQLGEAVAAAFLERAGMTIVARNLRSRLGEVDLVGEERGTLVFVEVKARLGDGGDPPQAAVDARKQARLGRLALGYLARQGGRERPCRFDVVAVTFARPAPPSARRARIEHFPGAFILGP